MRSRSIIAGFASLLLLGLISCGRSTASLPTIDHLVVFKSAHRLELYRHGALVATYKVALGKGGLAAKERSGDKRTPEGSYFILEHNPHSNYHNALRVSYPTLTQTTAAQAHGIDPGGDIMVHGIANGLGWLGPLHRLSDWTAGCIALTDSEIDRIAPAVPDGTPIDIHP